MAKVIEAYNPHKIEIIKRMLEKQSTKGSPLFYEVFVDNFKVVMKTNDIAEFDSYEDVMNNDTKYIRINTFSSPTESIAQSKYVFEIEEKKQETQKGLGEVVDINAKIKESIEIERERWDREHLLKELDRTKLELQEAEEYIDDLQNQLEKGKTKANHWGKLDLGLLAGTALEGMVRKNPQWLTKVPGLEGLAGVIVEENSDNGKRIDTPLEETEVGFSEKKAPAKELTEEEKEYLQFGKEIAENFENEEIRLLVKIIHEFKRDASQLKIVAELLHVPV
jgi:hypothetical protein